MATSRRKTNRRAQASEGETSAGASVASTRRPSRRPPVPAGWQPRITDQAALDEALDRLPEQPGVYLMRDRKGEVIYVGKARRLRVRVRQYFSGHDTRVFVPLLAKIVGDIETVVTANNKEALLLENNLIKEHRPRFNVKLRDDSNYLVIRLDPRAQWPRLTLVRALQRDGAQHFGPYHSASSARSTLRVVNRHFQLRTCTDYTLTHRRRPCLQHQIGRCPAPCVYDIDEAAYGEQVRDVALFLSGRHRELVDGLRQRMESKAAALEFEVAARVRDQLSAIETTLQSQQVVGNAALDQDAIGMYREGGQVEFVVMNVRQGRLLGSRAFSETGMEHPDAEVLANFLSAYYHSDPLVPDEILIPHAIDDDDLAPLTAWLRDKRGKKVAVAVAERGDRRKLSQLAARNAASSFATRRNRQDDADAALARLKTRLSLSKMPRTIECFDVSHTQGAQTVASMVVFVDGMPVKARYRSFRIRGATAIDQEGDALAQGAFHNDDFASMYEVLGRRFRRALQGDDTAWALPDLIVIDGGKGQLSRVVAAMSDLGIPVGAEGVDVVALAKERRGAIVPGREVLETLRGRARDEAAAPAAPAAPAVPAAPAAPGQAYQDLVVEEARRDEPAGDGNVEIKPERVFVPGTKDAIRLRHGSSERYLMERIRDEAHRFAITHHRKRRGKKALRSVLDDIEGVGPTVKKALLLHFGTVAAIKAADAAALAEVRGVGPALAERIAAGVRSP
jgi:excinuclease ABC subunit C